MESGLEETPRIRRGFNSSLKNTHKFGQASEKRRHLASKHRILLDLIMLFIWPLTSATCCIAQDSFCNIGKQEDYGNPFTSYQLMSLQSGN